MKELDPKTKKLLKYKQDQSFATFESINELGDKLDAILQKGIPFGGVEMVTIKGDKGDPGNDGYSPSVEEVAKTVMRQIHIPEDGKDGVSPSVSDVVEEVMSKIKIPKDGKDADEKRIIKKVLQEIPKPKDGSPDKAEDIAIKLNTLTGALDWSVMRGAPKEDPRLPKKDAIHRGGAAKFKELEDTPKTYIGEGGKFVVVKMTEDGLEFTPTSSVAGINRIIQNVSSNITLSSVSLVDYVYLASGNITLTLPTAAGNTNRYTVKNVGVGSVIIDTTGGQTIDGGPTAPLLVPYVSVDIISDGSNWFVV